MPQVHHAARWLVPLLALFLAPFAHAQNVAGEVEFSRGVGFAQTPGQAPRTLGKGLPLKEGDRLTTSEGGSAVIRLQDGTRMTVRPNSEIVLAQYQFKENASDNSMLMQLLRGGFRAVTGAITKSSPNAARIQTSTATIGIRGTDFDARLCARDCAQESAAIPEAPRPNQPLASAKVAAVEGDLFAVDAAGNRRRLVQGGGVYPGETVETSRGGRAVLAFRDDSRISLGSQTRFRVDNFVYDKDNAREGRFLVSILRGSVRALTGLIAKANNRNVSFNTATATIGIRGTGFDVKCTGPCAGEPPEPGDPESGLTLWTWLGSIEVAPGVSALQVLSEGQGLFITADGRIIPIENRKELDAPQPQDGTPTDQLFSRDSNVNDGQEGLFVFVRDGHVQIVSGSQILDLGRGEAGYAGNGQVGFPEYIPKFIDFDKIPTPDNASLLKTILGDENIPTQKQVCS